MNLRQVVWLHLVGILSSALCTQTVTIVTTITKIVTLQPSFSPTPAPVSQMPPGRSQSPTEYLTVSITNLYGNEVSLSFGSDVGAPTPLNDPAATRLSNASVTRYLFPTGWAGRVAVGPNLDPYGSKIEASFTGPPDVDVSYVDGYSVPLTCSSRGEPVSGCNIDLFKQRGNPCEILRDGPVCYNSAQNIPEGPPPRFFAACRGSAYTFPQDDGANVGDLQSNVISCCVGSSCEAPARQNKTTSPDIEQGQGVCPSVGIAPYQQPTRGTTRLSS